MTTGGFWQGYKGGQLASEVNLVFSSTSVAFRQGLTPAAWGRTQQGVGSGGGADAEMHNAIGFLYRR